MSRRYDFNMGPIDGQAPLYNLKQLHSTFDHQPHDDPEPGPRQRAAGPDPAPGARNTHFDADFIPTNAGNAREYIRDLIVAVQSGQIDPRDHDFTKINNLHGADLQGLPLNALGPQILSQINFGGTNLSGQHFTGDMYKFQAKGAILHNTVFDGANMQDADFEDARFQNTTFTGGTDARGANFTHAQGSVKMHNMTAQGAFFSGAALTGTAHNVNMSDIHARQFNMAGLNISGPRTSFQNAELDEATLSPRQHAMFSQGRNNPDANPALSVKSMASVKISDPSLASAHIMAGAIHTAPTPFATA
jgi:uncharacterized protein YjbI with pentapeptide repeats